MNRKLLASLVLVLSLALTAGTAMAATVDARLALLEKAVALLSVQAAAANVKIAVLQHQLSDAKDTIAQLQQNSVMALAPYLTVDTTNHRAVFSGINLQLVNGAGSTNTVNGLGNLIVGYDAECLSDGCTANVKSGSHYVIVGDRHNYSQYGGIVVGAQNSSLAPWASVTGGTWNTASGVYSSVTGGEVNAARGTSSTVSGGGSNLASGSVATVSGGGGNNQATGSYATVSGGKENTADGAFATVSGGAYNMASATNASISGGEANSISSGATSGSVSGGHARYVHEPYNWAAGSLLESQ